jgi:multicomponent K+:H+ antiporter subunit G
MNIFAEILISLFILIGAFFMFVGSFGLAKLPDTFRRLHGPTKATTLGIGSLLIASMMFFLFGRGQLSFHELLISIFLFLTAPIVANMLAKAHLLHDRRVQRELSPAAGKSGWATLGPDKRAKLQAGPDSQPLG